jgi:hypothetical protein
MEMILQNSIDALIAFVLAMVALWQYYKSGIATKQTNSVISALTPGDDSVTTAPEILPGRSWKMSDETKRWLTFDHPVEERESLIAQVTEAEKNRLLDYEISFPGGYYKISSGLLAGSGRGL